MKPAFIEIIAIIWVLIIFVIIKAFKKESKRTPYEKHPDGYNYDSIDENPSMSKDFIENHQTKDDSSQMSEEEKLQDAMYTIKHPSRILPGFGSQNPIDNPEENIELDSKEIPWELKENDDDT